MDGTVKPRGCKLKVRDSIVQSVPEVEYAKLNAVATNA